MTGSAVELRNIGLVYKNGFEALRDVSFTVPEGAFCVVLGPSGAGKSTLLRMLNGLVRPTHGEVRVAGIPLDKAGQKTLRPQISMVYQHFNLVGRASVAGNVIAGALPEIGFWRGMVGIYPQALKHKACELIAAVGLEEVHLSRRVDQMSGGQQQRVGVARAFMMNPRLILADEPVASLDPRTSRDILALLQHAARQRGATVICSLHQIELAREFADMVVILRQGRLAACGGRDTVMTAEHLEKVYGVAV